MENLFTTAPTTLMGWLGLITIAIFGIFALLNIFDKSLNMRRRESDRVDQHLITSLQASVASLEKVIEEKSKQLTEATIKMEKLITENETLKSVLQGRDNATVEFQKEGLKAMKKADTILKIAERTSKSVERLARSIDTHLERQETRDTNAG